MELRVDGTREIFFSSECPGCRRIKTFTAKRDSDTDSGPRGSSKIRPVFNQPGVSVKPLSHVANSVPANIRAQEARINAHFIKGPR